MSNFTLDLGQSTKHELERKVFADELLEITKECQKKFGSKTELATEGEPRIIKLCEIWEKVLSHGLRSQVSMLKNVTDLVSGTNDSTVFWDFALKHLTNHEKERFGTLRHVWTNCGKGRALIRAALNERALERYILVWLGDRLILEDSYESWAIMRNDEITSLLPNIAAGLSTILFAIQIDSPDLNVTNKQKPEIVRQEPIVATPPPQHVVRKQNAVKRQIITFDEPQKVSPVAIFSPQQSQSINIIKEHTDISNMRSNIQEEVYSVEQALIGIQRQSSIEQSDVTPKGSVDSNVLEASEDVDLISSSFSQDYLNSVSSSSSTASNSVLTNTNVEALKKKLMHQEERIQFLEARVAELSLENHRLKNSSLLSRPLTYFTVSIPRASLKKIGSKEYYSYEIQIIPMQGGDQWSVFRRYNEFYKMHKQLERQNPSIKILDFPPKKKLGNMNADFVEQRRQRLQVYLKHLISILPDVSSCNTRSQLERAMPFLCSERN